MRARPGPWNPAAGHLSPSTERCGPSCHPTPKIVVSPKAKKCGFFAGWQLFAATRTTIMKSMPRLRFALLLLLFVLAAMPGWATAHARHGGRPSGGPVASGFGARPATAGHPEMVAVADLDDGACDADCYGCDDPHCKHGCSTGCSMVACAGSGAALFGTSWTVSYFRPAGALDPLITQPPPLARASSPLRAPIA